METFVNEYYQQVEAAKTEADRAQVKAEFAAKLQTLSNEQRQQVKTLIGERIDSFLESLAPIDEAIDRFETYLHQRDKEPITNAA